MTGSLFTSDVLESTSATNQQQQQQQQVVESPNVAHSKEDCDEDVVYDWSSGLEEQDDSLLYFYPDQENIIFASAIDGWGFRSV